MTAELWLVGRAPTSHGNELAAHMLGVSALTAESWLEQVVPAIKTGTVWHQDAVSWQQKAA